MTRQSFYSLIPGALAGMALVFSLLITPAETSSSPGGFATGAPGTSGLTAPLTSTVIPRASHRLFDGLHAAGFEVSSFVPNGVECPGYGVGFWLTNQSDEFARVHRSLKPTPALDQYNIVRVRFWGVVSEPGQYGHVGAYEREVTVVELIDMEPHTGCPNAAPTQVPLRWPDLVVSSARIDYPGRVHACRPPGSEARLMACVSNLGTGPARDFEVRLGHDDQRVEVPLLHAGDELCLPPQAVPTGHDGRVAVDPDDEVEELLEHNNEAETELVTPEPLPTCSLDRTPTPTPEAADLAALRWPNLVMSTMPRQGWCVPEYGELRFQHCVGNFGGSATGGFVNQNPLDANTIWEVPPLGPSAAWCGGPKVSPDGVVIDARDDVAEANEVNNRIFGVTATPPRVCPPQDWFATPVTPTTTPDGTGQRPTATPTDTTTVPIPTTPGTTVLPPGPNGSTIHLPRVDA